MPSGGSSLPRVGDRGRGRVDVRLSVIARDLAHYHELYRARIVTLPHIAEIEALMQVATIKTNERLPL